MHVRNLTSICILGLMLSFAAKSQSALVYMGFGVSLNFDLRQRTTSIAGKYLVGAFTEDGFIQVSLAAQQPFFRKSRHGEDRFAYLEIQRGILATEERIVYGGGFGFSFMNTRQGFMLLPRGSAFAGRINWLTMIFANTEVRLMPSEKIHVAPGFEFAMPFVGLGY